MAAVSTVHSGLGAWSSLEERKASSNNRSASGPQELAFLEAGKLKTVLAERAACCSRFARDQGRVKAGNGVGANIAATLTAGTGTAETSNTRRQTQAATFRVSRFEA